MNVKQLYIAIIVQTLMLSTAWAQGPNHTGTYYQAADGQCGEALKTAFFQIINGEYQGVKFKQISYTKVWGAFATTDVLEDSVTIRDRYSNITSYQLFDGQASGGSGTEGGGGYAREHSLPQSWFKNSTVNGTKIGPGTDLYHLYPVDSKVNGMRSNLPYGENNGEGEHSANYYSKKGVCTFEGYDSLCFEPNDEWKGDFARTYFYMVTCYENVQPLWASEMLNSTTYPSFSEWALRLLLKWSRQDPVDSIEIRRNEAVCVIQHNRNPFIDYPGLEEFIWGDSILQAFAYGGFEEGGDSIITPPDTIVVEKEDTIYLPAKKYQFRKVLRVIGGKRYIIITDVEGKLRMAQPLAGNYGYIKAEDVSATNDSITLDSDKNAFTLFTTTGGYHIKDSKNRYVYQTLNYDSFNVAAELPEEGALWTIETNDVDSTFIITNVDKQKYVQYSLQYKSYGSYSGSQGLLPNLYEEVETLVGDINNDGSVNVADVTALVNLFNDKSLRDGDRFNLHAADANEDGVVTRSDIQSLIGIVLGR
jgi:endonuclease I